MLIDVSRRAVLLVMFIGLLISKYLGMNSIIDDLILLVAGAVLGKEIITERQKKKE